MPQFGQQRSLRRYAQRAKADVLAGIYPNDGLMRENGARSQR